MIKNIIFDFGDVFINLDKEATARMLIGRGFAGITPDLWALFNAYEKGLVSTDIFLERSKKWVPKAKTSELIEAWNAILLDFPDYRLEFLEGLSKEGTYRLFLLSNTNALHMERVIKKMGEERFQRFMSSFEFCYFSHEIHMRKPDIEIFEHILEGRKLRASETLFIDDTLEHTISANRLGIQTWHLQVGREDIIGLKAKLRNDRPGS